MPEFDVEALRARFPALSIEQDGVPVALFDGPGGTQVPDSVIEAVATYYRTSNANHDGPFLTSRRSDAVVEEAHAALADLLNAADPSEIKLGANMTTAHDAPGALGRGARCSRATRSSSRRLDHEANVGPWRERRGGPRPGRADRRHPPRRRARSTSRPSTPILHERPKLVAFGWASNAVGTINPVAELVHRAHEAGSLTFVDAVHAAPHLPIDVQAVGTDFLACSAYKFFGPHVGRAVRAPRGARRAADLQAAGRERPLRDRAPSTSRASPGRAAAVEYIAEVGRRFGAPFAGDFPGMTGRRLETHAGMAAIRAYEMPLFGRLLDGLEAIPGAKVWGITDRSRFAERTPTAAVTFAGHTPEDVATALGDRGIATWWGNFYAAGVVERLGLEPQGRAPDRPHPLQHGRRGGPPAGGAARDRRAAGRARLDRAGDDARRQARS